jgi:hypothetical protein
LNQLPDDQARGFLNTQINEPTRRIAAPSKPIRFQGVSVFGSSPPGVVVATGVADSLGVSDADALGLAVAVSDADAEAEALAEADADALEAVQLLLVMVLVSSVTAAFRASSWPMNVAPVFAVIDSIAIT